VHAHRNLQAGARIIIPTPSTHFFISSTTMGGDTKRRLKLLSFQKNLTSFAFEKKKTAEAAFAASSQGT
jgi:hypothetical protein